MLKQHIKKNPIQYNIVIMFKQNAAEEQIQF